MSVKDSAKLIGKIGTIKLQNGLLVEVMITDVKTSYGRTRYLVTPIAGERTAWVEDLKIMKEAS